MDVFGFHCILHLNESMFGVYAKDVSLPFHHSYCHVINSAYMYINGAIASGAPMIYSIWYTCAYILSPLGVYLCPCR
jgi:hypothetical protein